MARCPKCKKIISHLDSIYFVEFKSRFNPNTKAKQFSHERPTGNNYRVRFLCPLCETQIFNKYEDALAFMR
jgi:hypothetical protein